MNGVKQDHVPQQIPNGDRPHPEEGQLSIQILQLQLAHPSKGVFMDSLEGGGQVLNLPWPFDSRGPRLWGHLALLDSKGDVRVTLGQVPRELTQ